MTRTASCWRLSLLWLLMLLLFFLLLLLMMLLACLCCAEKAQEATRRAHEIQKKDLKRVLEHTNSKQQPRHQGTKITRVHFGPVSIWFPRYRGTKIKHFCTPYSTLILYLYIKGPRSNVYTLALSRFRFLDIEGSKIRNFCTP